MFNIEILRKKASYDYKSDPLKPDSWELGANDRNNLLDEYRLYHNGETVFACHAQTVANMPFGRYKDTIAPGPFRLRLFIEQRLYWPAIHGIMDTFDLEGQRIDENSVETVPGKDGAPIDFNRWLDHDQEKLKPSPQGIDTRVAWSLGCFVKRTVDHAQFNAILSVNGLKVGDVLEGILKEVE